MNGLFSLIIGLNKKAVKQFMRNRAKTLSLAGSITRGLEWEPITVKFMAIDFGFAE